MNTKQLSQLLTSIFGGMALTFVLIILIVLPSYAQAKTLSPVGAFTVSPVASTIVQSNTIYLPLIMHNYNPLTVTIKGRVIDSLDVPVNGINIAIIQDSYRTDAYSDSDGYFYADVPRTSNPIWNVQIVGILCSSRVMDPQNCVLKGYFQRNYNENVSVPQSQSLVFVFEKATTVISGTVVNAQGQPLSDIRVFAFRSDSAWSWGQSFSSGNFELPASDGSWDAYAVRFNPWTEGIHVGVIITDGVSSPSPVILTMP